MKQEVAKQNSLQTRPILILELNDNRPLLKNEGRGPALNAVIEEFSVRFLDRDRSELTNEVFVFIPPVFVPVGFAHELKMYSENTESGNRGTVSEPDVLFQIGNTINITIRYEDIQGANYRGLKSNGTKTYAKKF